MATRTTTKPYVENSQYLKFANRILRAMGRRAANDIDSLVELGKLRDEVDAQLTRAMIACHDEGYSYTDIGHRIGVSKQAVAQRIARASLLTGGITVDGAA